MCVFLYNVHICSSEVFFFTQNQWSFDNILLCSKQRNWTKRQCPSTNYQDWYGKFEIVSKCFHLCPFFLLTLEYSDDSVQKAKLEISETVSIAFWARLFHQLHKIIALCCLNSAHEAFYQYHAMPAFLKFNTVRCSWSVKQLRFQW